MTNPGELGELGAIGAIRDGREVSRWDMETDVLVVGLGCAGAAAAIEASRGGADVIVLERASGGGGTSAMSGGVIYLGGGTPVQRECGFEDSAEDMFKYLMATAGSHPDEEKIKAYSEHSVEHYHWLVAQDVEFKPVFYPHYSGEPPTDDGLVFSGSENAYPYSEIARPAPRGHVPRIAGAAGALLMQKLVAAVERTDAKVLTDARCRTLVRAPDGAVVGVVAKLDGEERLLRARRGVILTTGGFITNRRMVELYAPLLLKCSFQVGGDGDDGSGIRMAAAAGSAVINMAMGSISLPIIPPKQIIKGILINAHGQRFINEDAYFGRLGEYVLYRQDGRAYLVLDNETFVRPEIERELAAVGETAAEIEHTLGLPARSLDGTLALYNHYAERGEDPVFGKSSDYVTPLTHPPYGVLDCTTEKSIYAAFTLGGLHTTVDAEVLTVDGEIIPGLFAAGRTASLMTAPGYSSGLSIGDGTFFGRRAGRRAASASLP